MGGSEDRDDGCTNPPVLTLPSVTRPQSLPQGLLENAGPAGAFALGVAFALGWTPCVGPILASILTMALSGSDPVGGALLLFVYSLGLGIPFVVSGLFVGWALRTFSRVKRRMRLVQIVCGVILVLYGALLLSGRFGLLSSALSPLHLPSF